MADAERPADSRSLTTAIVQEFAGWLRETPTRGWRGQTERRPYGVHGSLKDLRAFVRWLRDEELLIRVVKVPVPKLPQTLFPVLTDEEVARIWKSKYLTSPSDQGKRNRALLALLFDTGVRRGEVVGLVLDDVDLDNQLITVWGKGDKQRRVPFSSGVAALLTEWIKARGEEPGSLFWLQAAGVRMLLCRIKADCGVDVLTPHQIRHTAATQMVRANMDLHSVKRVLGHSHISVTEKYLSLSDEDLRTKHAAASPFERIRSQMDPLQVARRKKRVGSIGG